MMSYADDIMLVDGIEMAIRDIPDQMTRALLGFGHFPREVAEKVTHARPDGTPWPCRPGDCLTEDYGGEWLSKDVFVCSGCGLDFT